MTLDKTQETSRAIIGPMRYSLLVLAFSDDGTDDHVNFTVNAQALPRIGDRMSFEAPGAVMSVTVTDISHWFYPRENDPPHRDILVSANADRPCHEDVKRLSSNDAELARWIQQFPMLEP